MSRIKIVDFFGIKSFHEVINLAIIVMCSQIFDKVIYFASRTSSVHIKQCYEKYKKDGGLVEFKSMPIYEKDSHCGAFVRVVIGFFITLATYLFRKKNTVVLYNYTNPLSMPLILMLNFLLRRKTIFLMHGELELLLADKIPVGKPSYWYRLCYIVSLKYLLKSNQALILVLGDSIKNNICKLYPGVINNVISICHPYFYGDKEINLDVQHRAVLTVGTVGVMKRAKGFDALIELSKELEAEIWAGNLIIKSIGRVEDIDINPYHNIQWIGGNDFLPRNIFEAQIQSLDFILYLYPQNSYKFTASGAIMDAVKLGKPIISFHNDYFDYLLGDSPIGYWAKDVKDMASIIRTIQLDRSDFGNNFEKLKKKTGILQNTYILKENLENHSYIL